MNRMRTKQKHYFQFKWLFIFSLLSLMIIRNSNAGQKDLDIDINEKIPIQLIGYPEFVRNTGPNTTIPGFFYRYKNIKYSMGYSGLDSTVKIIWVDDTSYRTPEGAYIGMSHKELLEITDSELQKATEWFYYYQLPSGWIAVMKYNYDSPKEGLLNNDTIKVVGIMKHYLYSSTSKTANEYDSYKKILAKLDKSYILHHYQEYNRSRISFIWDEDKYAEKLRQYLNYSGHFNFDIDQYFQGVSEFFKSPINIIEFLFEFENNELPCSWLETSPAAYSSYLRICYSIKRNAALVLIHNYLLYQEQEGARPKISLPQCYTGMGPDSLDSFISSSYNKIKSWYSDNKGLNIIELRKKYRNNKELMSFWN